MFAIIGSRSSFVVLVAGGSLLQVVPQSASATVGACTSTNDAPGFSSGYPCGSVCTESSNELVCDLSVLCPTDGAGGVVVTNFGTSTHDVSAWGTCNTGPMSPAFCCVFDEGATNVDTVILRGTDQGDEELWFNYAMGTGDERNLQPWDADPIHGYIQGKEGDDQIQGSNYAATDYDEDLNGNRGEDQIWGNAGADLLKGGDGDDTLWGGTYNDTLWGGDGDDTLYGEYGNDALCDASGYNACATDYANLLDGGAGDDRLWFDQSENVNVPCPNIRATFTPAAGTDQCGDENDWSHAEMGNQCESYITVVPPRCDGAN